MMTTNEDTPWRTPQFRQSMVNKIDEAIVHCGAPTTKNAIEMENQVFSKAKSKDEYLSFVARLIIHIKDMGSKKLGTPGMANQIPPQGNPVMGQMPGQQNMGMMNQMNSMGNMNMMNQQGIQLMNSGMNPNQNSMIQAALGQQQPQQMGQQTPNNQNQMLNQQNFMQQQQQAQMQGVQLQQNPQLQNPQLQNVQLQQQQQQQQLQNQQQQLQNVQMQEHMRNVQLSNAQMQNSPMAPIQINSSQLGNTQGPGDTQQIRAQLPQQQQSQQQQQMMARGIGNRMMVPQSTMSNHLSQMAKQQQQQQQQQQSQQRILHRPPNVDSVNMAQQYTGPNAGMVRNVIGPPPQQQQQQQQQQQTPPSPSQNPNYANSPAQSISTLMPSPASLRPFQSHGVPSPGSSIDGLTKQSINTPLMAASTPSPRNADDQACIDKIKELRKYTDLLQRMIAKIGNDDVEKSSKMKKLLEILTNPNHRVSMDILLKCEVALKKMERQQNDPGGVLGPQSTPQPPPIKEDVEKKSPFQQVMDALAGTLRNPSSSHTLLRTFRPTVEALFMSGFQNFEEEDGSSDGESQENDIPSILKRELRTLDSHFRVTIFKRGGGLLRLTCHLKSHQLPRVPALKINVRTDYPYDPPVVIHLARDYGSTSFLQAIVRAFKSRFLRLTPNHTVTEILQIWEMSIRQATNPNIRH